MVNYEQATVASFSLKMELEGGGVSFQMTKYGREGSHQRCMQGIRIYNFAFRNSTLWRQGWTAVTFLERAVVCMVENLC